MDKKLAWVARSTDTLYSLLEKDPYILKNVDASPFVHSPLHEASMHGRLDMAVELMILMPSFVSKLNTSGLSPLHLAVENRQVEMALELVKFDPNLVRLRGRGGVTPLHLVVEKGDVELLTEFLMACPKSILDVNASGETAIHTAVMNGRYEELKALTGWIRRMRQSDAASIETDILDRKNRDGNTALHVAAYENKHEALKLLLTCTSLDRNIINKDGFTPLDILRANGRYMDKKTEKLLQRSGGKSKAGLSKVKTCSEFLRSPVKFWEYCSIRMTRYRSGISDGNRNALLVITILVITATYGTALQPPRALTGEDKGSDSSSTVVYLYNYEGKPRKISRALWGFNTMAFLSALALNFVLLPLGREYTWFYILISAPLCCSYGLAMYLNDNDTAYFQFFLALAIMVALPCYILFIFLKWKWPRKVGTPKPKSQIILKGWSTMV